MPLNLSKSQPALSVPHHDVQTDMDERLEAAIQATPGAKLPGHEPGPLPVDPLTLGESLSWTAALAVGLAFFVFDMLFLMGGLLDDKGEPTSTFDGYLVCTIASFFVGIFSGGVTGDTYKGRIGQEGRVFTAFLTGFLSCWTVGRLVAIVIIHLGWNWLFAIGALIAVATMSATMIATSKK